MPLSWSPCCLDHVFGWARQPAARAGTRAAACGKQKDAAACAPPPPVSTNRPDNQLNNHSPSPVLPNRSAQAEGAGLPPGTPLLQAITRDADMAYVKAKGARNLEPPKHSGRQDAPPREPPLPKHEDALLHFSVMPDDHQMYAATWAIMSALTAIMARIVIRKAGRRIYYA